MCVYVLVLQMVVFGSMMSSANGSIARELIPPQVTASSALSSGEPDSSLKPNGLWVNNTVVNLNDLPASDDDEAPWFCHGIDCPRYTVLSKHDGYEVRKYEATKWTSTVVPGMALLPAMNIGFMRLFGYISGANLKGTSIPMTSPVKNAITPAQGPFCSTNFTISFFVPFEMQESTPEPASEEVFFTYEEPMIKYVKQFGGFGGESTMVEEASSLAKTLLGDGMHFDPEHYEYCSYDPPFRLLNRQNEIWFTKTSSESDDSAQQDPVLLIDDDKKQ